MITQVTALGNFVRINIACTAQERAAADPSSAEANFYKVSDNDGSLSLYTDVGTNGVITLVKQDSEDGFYGAAVDVDDLDEGQYVVLFKVTIDEIDSIGVDYLAVGEDPHLRACVANAVYSNSSDTLTVNAWVIEHGSMVTSPVDCEFTLYDDSGDAVFSPLTSDSADDNGVFRLTKAEPGLAHDKSYYGKVEIDDGFNIFTGLVGLVTVE